MGKSKQKAGDIPKSGRSTANDVPKSNRSSVANPKEMEAVKLENEILTKNNKLLAQKVADLEHNRNLQRKASFISGADSVRSGAGTPSREMEHKNSDLNNVFYQGASSPEQ